MNSIGGFFAELKLTTDSASFSKGKKALDEVGESGKKATRVFVEMQKQYNTGRVWEANASGKGRVKGKASIQPGTPSEDSGQESFEITKQKKQETLQRALTLFMLYKMSKLMKDLIKGMYDLASATGKQMNQRALSAEQAGMSATSLSKWQEAFKTSAIDFDSFKSGAIGLANAFNDLKLGDSSKLEAIAKDLGQLGLKAGDLIGQTNDERITSVFNAAYKDKDRVRARRNVESILGEGAGQALLRMWDTSESPMAWREDKSKMLLKGTVPTKESRLAAEDMSQFTQFFDNLHALFGADFNLSANATIKKFNEKWGGDQGKARIENAMKRFTDVMAKLMVVIDAVLSAFVSIQEAMEWADKQLYPLEQEIANHGGKFGQWLTGLPATTESSSVKPPVTDTKPPSVVQHLYFNGKYDPIEVPRAFKGMTEEAINRKMKGPGAK
jgi:hypothetical protein